MKKRLLSIVMAVTMAFGLVACSTPEASSSNNNVNPDNVANEVSTSALLGGDDGSVRSELTALELTTYMGNGINLGNTMEAYGRAEFGTTGEIYQYETFWGQPETTQEIISGMKAAGFDTLRIPVAWTNKMNFEEKDYTIDPALLDRVEEIVGYARSEGMYVIINDHWDGSWWGMFGSATPETREDAMNLYTSMWTQISTRFAGYSDYVIFESANEEVGDRLNDTDVAADSGTLSTDECYATSLLINQAFVDTVRSTGGNNAERFLLIAGYGTDITQTCDSRFKMPTDTADSKLLISVHYYEPSGYALFESIDSWGVKDDYDKADAKLSMMQSFTEQGYGVIIGEYGALPLNGRTVKNNTYEYTLNILNECDIYGYVPVLWDTNGMYNKTYNRIIDKQVAELYLDRAYDKQKDMSYDDVIASAKASQAEAIENAPEGFALEADKAVAWIMFTSGDWSVQYSVGDIYDPSTAPSTIVAVDQDIDGEGTYTVSLDFTGLSTGEASGCAFSALAIANGEILFPGYIIDIKEIKLNGEVYELKGIPYTSSDDQKCTRVNLFNEWVNEVPDDIRTVSGVKEGATPRIIDTADFSSVQTLEITFDYIAK